MNNAIEYEELLNCCFSLWDAKGYIIIFIIGDGETAGIVIAVLILLVIICALLFYCKKSSDSSKEQVELSNVTHGKENIGYQKGTWMKLLGQCKFEELKMYYIFRSYKSKKKKLQSIRYIDTWY